MKILSFDVGTYNLVCCTRNKEGNFSYKKEINAFLELPTDNKFVFNMMKNAGVPLIEKDKVAYALGEAAVNMAYTLPSLELKRPMSDGCVNPKEKDAFQILSIMIHSLIGDIEDNGLLYYCIPSNAINQETDADYHSKVLQAIFGAYESTAGKKIEARPINEALALVYAEAADKNYTAISASFGGGMVNICFAMYGNPIFQFAVVNSGDWIDKQAAKATGESPTFINKQKMNVSLKKDPSNLVERAIQTQYKLMIEKAVSMIKNGLSNAGKSVRIAEPIDFIIAGGTSSIDGFTEVFEETIKNAELSIPIGKVIRPHDPLFSVARGCLIAAEASLKWK